ncbi:DUF2339 domain-containing protein [Sporosarcina beigongshangi]|uniref:DUF2339 domain-containing protein n=1 Tax=Sporosarcina beigongshangi TaxID=2782538 RepID=UPI001939485D|nr:DUF2339 domain-containing protein [Sporosarcina beigongshangi]
MNKELKAVFKRVTVLEQEVASLKRQLAGKEVVVPEQAPTMHVAAPVKHPDQVATPKQDIPVRVPTVRKEFNLEKALGIWLPRVFMFILLLGVLWGLKVGMDHGVITNPVRVALGYAGTVLLYYLGMRYVRGGKKGFGLTLLGGFIALGILTTFAAHHLYGYLSFTIAFLLGVVYIVVGLLLSRKMKSETLTLFSGIAGFLLPFLLEGEGTTAIQFCAYILLLFLSLFYVSLSQRHKFSFYVTFVLFHLTLFFYAILDGSYDAEGILVTTVLIQHGVILFFYVKGKISRTVFSEGLLYSNFMFTIAWVKLLDHVAEIAVYGLVAFVYCVLAMYTLWKKDYALQGVLSAVAVFALSVLVLSFDLEDSRVVLMLLLLNGTLGIWVGVRYETLRTIVTGSIVYLFALPAVLTTVQIEQFWSLEHAVWLVFLASVGWLFYTLYRWTPTWLVGKTVRIDGSLIAGQVLVLLYLNQLTVLWLSSTSLAFETAMHVQRFVMLVVLCAMYTLHKWRKGLYVAHSTVILFLILSLSVMLAGLGVFNAHGEFLFNFLVQVLYAAVFTVLIWAMMKDRFYLSREKLKWHVPQLAVVLQVFYFIYLNKWYFSFIAAYAWDLEYVLLVHTFSLFTFAFVSISVGGKQQWKWVKFIGAGLIVVCVLKLFIIDLASISILIRAILFTIVGVVGLIYSRTLLKEEK